jgi:hypothetical protein
MPCCVSIWPHDSGISVLSLLCSQGVVVVFRFRGLGVVGYFLSALDSGSFMAIACDVDRGLRALKLLLCEGMLKHVEPVCVPVQGEMPRLSGSQGHGDGHGNPERFDSSNSTSTQARKLSVTSKQTDTPSHLQDLAVRPSAYDSSSSSIFSEPFNDMFVTAGGSPSDTRTSSASQHTAHSTPAAAQSSSRLSHSVSASQHSSRQPSPVHNTQRSPPGSQRHSQLYRSTSSRKESSVHARSSDSRSPTGARVRNPVRVHHTPGVELAAVEAHPAPAPQMLVPTSQEFEGPGQAVQMAPWSNGKRDAAKGPSKHSLRAKYEISSQNIENLSNSSLPSSTHPSSKLGDHSRESSLARRSRADSVHNLFAPSAQNSRPSSLLGAGKPYSSSSRSMQLRNGSMERERPTSAGATLEGRASDANKATQAVLKQQSDVKNERGGRDHSPSPVPQRKARVDAPRVDTRWAGPTPGAGGRGVRQTAARTPSAGSARGKGREPRSSPGSSRGRSNPGRGETGLPRGVGIGRPL